jgi:hypothetical protein
MLLSAYFYNFGTVDYKELDENIISNIICGNII